MNVRSAKLVEVIRRVWQFLIHLILSPAPDSPLPRQGYRRSVELFREEWQKPTFGFLRLFRLCILASACLSPTALVDQIFRSTSRSVVGLSRELLYQRPRDLFFLVALLTPLYHSKVVIVLMIYLVLDILSHLAGGTLVWGEYSIDPLRSLVLAVVDYFEIIVAFAVFYLHCDCLNVRPVCAVQALYFSFVTGTTLGFGDLRPEGFHGQVLVMSQLAIFVVFVLVFLATLQSRASQSKQ